MSDPNSELKPPPLAGEIGAALDALRLDFVADALGGPRATPLGLRSPPKPATSQSSPSDRARPASRSRKPASFSVNSARRRRPYDLRPPHPLAAPGAGARKLRQSLLAGRRRPMLQAPTGFGKTLTAAHIIQRALDKGKRVAFTVPSINLIDQTVAAFEAEGISLRSASCRAPTRAPTASQPVQICSVQTLDQAETAGRRPRSRRRGARALPRSSSLDAGLPQTFRSSACRRRPGRADSANITTTLIVAATTADLIRDGFLSPFTAYAPSNPDLSFASRPSPATSRKTNFRRRWTARHHRRHRRRLAQARRGSADLAFSASTASTPSTSTSGSRKSASPAEYMDGDDRARRPRGHLRALPLRRRRGSSAMSACWRPASICRRPLHHRRQARPSRRILLRPGRSAAACAPRRARIDLRILDHAGNHLRLGLVTRHPAKPSSTTARKTPRSASSANSPNRSRSSAQACKAVLPVAAKACLACGAPVRDPDDGARDRGRPGRARGPPERQARLSGVGAAAVLRRAARAGRRARAMRRAGRRHQFKQKFGHWPNGYDRVAMEPSVSTRNWVRSRQIALRRRGAHEKQGASKRISPAPDMAQHRNAGKPCVPGAEFIGASDLAPQLRDRASSAWRQARGERQAPLHA